ncbi:MAG: peptide deformylase [Pseudomonadota bacterium]|nr:peptide deformylase [Pseudomonadota bacterium]
MAKREIITIPAPLLRKPSAAIERVDDDLRALMDDMLETMYAAPGIGLAAVQVAVPRRVIVMDTSWREKDGEEGGEPVAKAPICMVNPEILAFSDELRPHEEGCLSIPDFYAEIERPRAIRVRYIDREGHPQEITAEDVLATVIQHEVDHLDGKLFIDYLSRLKRDRVIKKFVKAAKGEVVA